MAKGERGEVRGERREARGKRLEDVEILAAFNLGK